jgi:Transposase
MSLVLRRTSQFIVKVAALGLQLARLGRQVPRRMVSADHAFADRADEADRALSASTSRVDPQVFPGPKLISSGVVEGLNNKAKVTMRKSYGFRTYRVLELALYHALGTLPEPESTHDFF